MTQYHVNLLFKKQYKSYSGWENIKMIIKILELNNFKSFNGKTAISFADGLTVITGLNGTGKSNIFDAINFALGKYKAQAKSLINKGKKEASVNIVLMSKDKYILSIHRKINIYGEESLCINGRLSNDKDIPCNDFNFTLLDSDSHNQFNRADLKTFMDKLKEESNKKQIILASTKRNTFDYADQIICVQTGENKLKVIKI